MINRDRITGPLGWSVAAIAITAIVVLVQVPPLLVALVTPGAPDDDAVTSRIQEVVKISQTLHAAHKDRFNGRYLFFAPRPPPPPPQETTIVQAPTVETPQHSVDVAYTGPLQVLFPFGDVVWFKDQSGHDVTLTIGQERDGVTLTAINAPYSVRVKWHDKEWDLEQFKDWKKPGDLFPLSGALIAQPAAQVPGFTVVPQDQPDPAVSAEPAPEGPKAPQQSESTPQPARDTGPAAPAATVEPSSGAP